MSKAPALYSSEALKASNAKPFSSLEGKLDAALLRSINEVMHFEFMTPVQSQVLSELPTMRSDCLVQAKTGTGKTLAFLLPAVQSILKEPAQRGQVSVLIMSPTRELALQIAAEATELVSKLQKPLEVHTAFGGTAKAVNHKKFMRGNPSVLVATPGRLNDYLEDEETRTKFSQLQTLILDEADAMLEAGFLPDILRILRALPPKNKLKWQGMCFSATIPPKIRDVLSHVLDSGYTKISTIDASEPPTVARVPQFSVIIPNVKDTFKALFSLIQLEIKTDGESKIIVFGTTANLVALYAKMFERLVDKNVKVFELQSRLSQSQRTRTTDEFKEAQKGIMFATDVIGRGMDFPNVSLVVQVGLPSSAEAYTHRVGRTARAGKDGRAIILLTQGESFFLSVNRQFPIAPYAASENILNDTVSASKVSRAMSTIDSGTKRKAYSAYLGFMKTSMNKMRLNAGGLVRMANELALEGMETGEVPEMEKKTVGKMGLKGAPGLRYAETTASNGPRKQNGAPRHEADDSPQKRARHQGPPPSFNSYEGDFGSGMNTALGAGADGGPRGGSRGGRGGRGGRLGRGGRAGRGGRIG